MWSRNPGNNLPLTSSSDAEQLVLTNPKVSRKRDVMGCRDDDKCTPEKAIDGDKQTASHVLPVGGDSVAWWMAELLTTFVIQRYFTL